MLAHSDIETLLRDVPQALLEYRQAVLPTQIQLSSDMAAALGTPTRRLTPVLASVVSAIVDKLEIDEERMTANKVKDVKTFRAWLGDGAFSAVEKELYRAVVRDGSAYILTTWQGDSPVFTVRETYNYICGARVVYRDGAPAFAFNAWSVDGAAFVDFYYPDRVEKYRKADDKKDWAPRRDSPDEAWPVPWVAEDGTPLGIAITEFSVGCSDIESSLQIARDINEALIDLLSVSRVQGWPQRYLAGGKNPDVLTNAFGQSVVNGTGNPIRRTVRAVPGSIMLLSEGSEFGQLDSVTPNTAVLDKLIEMLSLVSTVPTHYFNDGQWPSGVALIQAESRLNHKIEQHQARLSTAVVTMLRLAMRLSNFFAGSAYDPNQPITIPWHSPEIETEDLKREREQFRLESIAKFVESGLMSRELAVRELHPNWDEAQIQAELMRLRIAA